MILKNMNYVHRYYQLHRGLPPPYGVVHRANNLYTLKPNKLLARCTTPYGGVNYGVTILSPTNHTFYWPKIIFKHVFGQFDVQ